MKTSIHNSTILKALRTDQKVLQRGLRRNEHYAKQSRTDQDREKWEGFAQRRRDELEDVAAAIAYMESLPIYLGCNSNKGGGK